MSLFNHLFFFLPIKSTYISFKLLIWLAALAAFNICVSSVNTLLSKATDIHSISQQYIKAIVFLPLIK